MKINELLLGEFDREMTTTRSLLERVPEAKADWKPHAKSYSLGALAAHVAGTVRYAVATIQREEVDFASAEAQQFRSKPFESTATLLEVFDRNVRDARAAIAGVEEKDLGVTWSLKNGAHTIFTLPRLGALRTFVMNHHIHHRGQLSVYLRELDVPLPSIYGPTADM